MFQSSRRDSVIGSRSGRSFGGHRARTAQARLIASVVTWATTIGLGAAAVATMTGCERSDSPTTAADPASKESTEPKAESGSVSRNDGKSDAGPTAAGTGETAQGKKKRIAVVPKGTTHDYWKSVHAGAMKAAGELGASDSSGIEVIFRGPEREDDRDQQVSLVENLVSSGYGAIVLAPLDEHALAGPVREATKAGVKVVVIDSGLKGTAGKDFVSYVATDNYHGGQLAAQRMGMVLKGTGKVLVLRYQEGSASTAQREAGFVETMGDMPTMQVVDPKRYAGATRDSAQEAAENLLAAHADIGGVFCPNESTTYGMLLALKARGLAGKVRLIGFDSSAGLVEALRAGEIDALAVQDPMKMGYTGVRIAADALDGKAVEQHVDTGVVLVTKETMDSAEMKELLSPDLEKWLNGRPTTGATPPAAAESGTK